MASKYITVTNWNYSRFINENQQAFISMICDETQKIHYGVTLMESEFQEISQEVFPSLNEACLFINNKYQQTWVFLDLSKSDKEGGCSSCVAH